MIYNYEKIKDLKILENCDDANFKDISYDIRIGRIINDKGKVVEKFVLEPNSVVVAISEEMVKLPPNVIGHAYVRTRLSQRGIMANNIGIIDPGYVGLLSSVIINFGDHPYEFKKGDKFLRLTFAEFTVPEMSKKLDYTEVDDATYVNDRRSDTIENIGKTFLNIDAITNAASEQVKEVVAKWFRNWTFVLLVLGIFFGGLGYAWSEVAPARIDSKKAFQELEERIDSYTASQSDYIHLLSSSEIKVRILTSKLDSLESVINSLNSPSSIGDTKK